MASGLRNNSLGDYFNPVVVDDDDDDNATNIAARSRRFEQETRTGQHLAELAARRHANRLDVHQPWSPSRSDDLLHEEAIEEILEVDLAEIIDLTADEPQTPHIFPRQSAPRDEAIPLPRHTLETGLVIEPGMTVELKSKFGVHEIQFVKIKSILSRGGGSEIVIRGFGFVRSRQLHGMLPRKLNEVVLMAEIRTSGPARWEEEALMDVPAAEVMWERDLRITNMVFPNHRFESSLYSSKGAPWVEDHAVLVCRSRYELHYNGNHCKPFEWAIVHMSESEADRPFRILDEQNLNRWRGGKIPGGSHDISGLTRPVVDLESARSSFSGPPRLSLGQRYTAGDVFAGAGGASRGIERAGVKLLFAVDHWTPAAESLRSNFPSSRIYERDVTDFIIDDATKCDVDMLHLSPPCQFWSPAHTVAGKNDEHNQAVLFSCTHLVEKFRPRVFTVEQTFGILSPKFAEHFNTFVNGFTRFGYSVRWKVTPLANYGVPQLRKRLIMLGSAPGEALPPFPPATHSEGGRGGLKPWATPLSVLAAAIPRVHNGHLLHRPHRLKTFEPPKPRWDPTRLARTITTNGGQNYHWTGRRDFTLLEYAVLQGFPTWHRFEGRYIKKQIGNAFAPSVVRVLYKHLVSWLLAQDGFGSAAQQEHRGAMPVSYATEKSEDDDEVVYLGPRTPHRLSEVVRQLNASAKEEDRGERMNLDDVDDLSDTETLRDGENGGGSREAMDVDVDLIDLELDWGGNGAAENPYLLLD
ncbi:S-adenosyl-L-methionine-dependent methyltransferase [Staphylotrichum tortipilum]|uniref:DNA (cytosine-5-)-methyltransferase n=1 Tax=Staphylotrichum tortipilum TaxID=2831512 RepID=A0AAN6MS66_9PEZI|nr:S-adenosyl-L-methionine-dependent methyltransferase [Staphylotrichum longicolle]